MKARRPGRTRGRSASETAREISSTIGPEFFESLVKNVGPFLGADCVYIGEFAGGKAEQVKTLAHIPLFAFTKIRFRLFSLKFGGGSRSEHLEHLFRYSH
jgi:hypothetical protein